jgi:hypothetical protein
MEDVDISPGRALAKAGLGRQAAENKKQDFILATIYEARSGGYNDAAREIASAIKLYLNTDASKTAQRGKNLDTAARLANNIHISLIQHQNGKLTAVTRGDNTHTRVHDPGSWGR